MDTPAQRLKWAREHKARYSSATAAAEARGWNASTYRGHENGQRSFPVSAAKRYAAAFGVPWLWLTEGGPLPDGEPAAKASTPPAIPTKGEVAAGLWLDLDVDVRGIDFEQYPIAADTRYPIDAQYGLVVRGTSMNRVANPGEVLHCIDLGIAGIEIKDGDFVIVERRRAQQGQREVTAKRVRQRDKTIILAPDTTDPRWQPIELDTENPPEDEEVGVLALVIGVYRPLTKFR